MLLYTLARTETMGRVQLRDRPCALDDLEPEKRCSVVGARLRRAEYYNSISDPFGPSVGNDPRNVYYCDSLARIVWAAPSVEYFSSPRAVRRTWSISRRYTFTIIIHRYRFSPSSCVYGLGLCRHTLHVRVVPVCVILQCVYRVRADITATTAAAAVLLLL